MKGRRLARIETALEVLSQFEVETLLLYTTEDVAHRFSGPEPFNGRGTGREALRNTMVRILRTYLGGFEPWEEGRHLAEDFAVLEWRCRVSTLTGPPAEVEGLLLVGLERDRIGGIRGLFQRSCSTSEDSQGQQVDQDGDNYRDQQEEDYG